MFVDHAFHRRPSLGRWLWLLLGVALAAALAGCERSAWDPTVKVGDAAGHVVDPSQARKREAFRERGGAAAESITLGAEDPVIKPADSLQRGTGNFVRKVAKPSVETKPGDVTLNFDGTDVREVVKVILGDLLKVNYVLHPAVQGVTSLQTGRPLSREDLIPTLETLLRMNNAAVVFRDGTYEVVPLANAVQGKAVPQLGDSTRALPQGFSVQVVPLRYIGAEEMNSILQPLAPEGSVIRVDNLRNLLVIAGTSPEMGNLLETIRVFDVDWMSGLSVGFFALEYAKAKDVQTQLEGLLAEEGSTPLKGVFRFVPIESANALLVVSPQESYIQQARNWIERLDMAEASGDASERVFVYRVKHSDATSLADTLSALFGGSSTSGSQRTAGSVAPGLGRSSIGSGRAGSAMATRLEPRTSDSSGSGLGSGASGSRSSGSGIQSSGTTQAAASAHEIQMSSTVSIVADAVNNSLLIRASARDYKKILDALKQVDITPLQVLVEATIVEITLSGNLEYGLQWELFGTASKGQSNATLDSDQTSGLTTKLPGFNWTVISSPDTVKATLSALANESLVNVLSSPSVMVMDNQTAKIQVGKEVPIKTSEQVSTESTNTYNSIEYKDTGVMLSVKPRVTPGGLVQLEIEQEVSNVDSTAENVVGSPTFTTRNITSAVAVRSNQSVVLGGLIQDQRNESKGGVPGLYGLPYIGGLFGERSKGSSRTELVVILTPKVISSDQDVESVTEDFRSKMKGLNFNL